MWRLIPAVLVVFLGSDVQTTRPAAEPPTTQSAPDDSAPDDVEARLYVVERNLAAVIHLIKTGEVGPIAPAASAPLRTGDDRFELQDLSRRVDQLERLVGGLDRNLMTQSPSGLRTDTDALAWRVDQLERQVRDQERTIQRLERRLDRPNRP